MFLFQTSSQKKEINGYFIMIIIQKNKDLLLGLNKAIGVIDRRSVQTIYSHFLFKAHENKLRLYASDGNMEMQASIKMEVAVEAPFSFTLPARKLHEICRNILPEENVTIELIDEEDELGNKKSTVAILKTESFNYKLQTKEPTSFPLISTNDEEGEKSSVWIQGTDLRSMLSKTAQSISITGVDGKPYMRGLTVQAQTDQKITVTAIDGLRMSHSERKHIHKIDRDRVLVIPRKGVMEIGRVIDTAERLEEKKEELHIKITNTYLSIISSSYTFITKLVDAHVPNHMGVVPNNLNNQFKFDTDHMLNSLRRSMVVLAEGNKLVSFFIKKGELILFARNSEEESLTESLETDFLGEEQEVILNANHLHDTLQTITSEKTQMCFADDRTNVLFKDTDNTGDWHVLAPYVRTETQSEEEEEEEEEDKNFEGFYSISDE